MRIESVRCAVLVAACLAGPALAQKAVPGPEGEFGVPAVEKVDRDAAVKRKLIPEVSLHGIPFSEVINFLRETDPAFQAVVAYAPEADPSHPIIQDLRLKNISADAVLQLIAAAYPQVQINKTEAADAWIVHIAPAEGPGGDGDGGGMGGGLFGGSGRRDEGAMTRAYTNLYRLREIVDEMVTLTPGDEVEEKARAGALESVLSLLQTALDTQGESKTPASIKLHQATETLVFKGTREQATLIDQALSNLTPPPDVQKQRSNRSIQQLEGELEKVRLQMREMQVRMAALLQGSSTTTTTAPTSPAPATPKQ